MPRRYREVALPELEVVTTKRAGARLRIEDVNDALQEAMVREDSMSGLLGRAKACSNTCWDWGESIFRRI